MSVGRSAIHICAEFIEVVAGYFLLDQVSNYNAGLIKNGVKLSPLTKLGRGAVA